VALFCIDLITTFSDMNVLMPILLAYDDMCHLLARMLSLMGAYWQAALFVVLIVILDRFHM
jgi:hypothetical protein